MKIKSVRARVFEWKGPTVPPQGNFCSNAMDLVYQNPASQHDSGKDTMNTFRFHGWTVVEVETDDGIVGLGNVALAPRIAKAIIDEYLAPLVIGQDPSVRARVFEWKGPRSRRRQLLLHAMDLVSRTRPAGTRGRHHEHLPLPRLTVVEVEPTTASSAWQRALAPASPRPSSTNTSRRWWSARTRGTTNT